MHINSFKKIIHIGREYGELFGAGGLRGCISGMSKAAARRQIETHVILPANSHAKLDNLRLIESPQVSMSVPMMMDDSESVENEYVSVKTYKYSGYDTLIIHILESDRFLYVREGIAVCERTGCYTYSETESKALGNHALYGESYRDSFQFDVLFTKAALQFIESYLPDADLIHCHDGHVAILPFLANNSREFEFASVRDIPVMLTLYNLADRYRGEVDYGPYVSKTMGVSDHLLKESVHNGQFDPVIAAGLSGAYVSVMGRNYLHESISCGHDALNSWTVHKMLGLGIPLYAFDGGIEQQDASQGGAKHKVSQDSSWSDINLNEKSFHKAALLKRFELDNKNNLPLFTFVGRLAHQKGYGIMADVIESLLGKIEFTLVGVGVGHRSIAERLQALQRQAPNNIRILTDYDSDMARRIYAGGDFFLMPSLFEPFGTADLVAMLNGNIPIVHAVGGLIKVVHHTTGYSYVGGASKLRQTILEAHGDYYNEPEHILAMRSAGRNLVKEHYTWDMVMDHQLMDHYKAAIEMRRPLRGTAETVPGNHAIPQDAKPDMSEFVNVTRNVIQKARRTSSAPFQL